MVVEGGVDPADLRAGRRFARCRRRRDGPVALGAPLVARRARAGLDGRHQRLRPAHHRLRRPTRHEGFRRHHRDHAQGSAGRPGRRGKSLWILQRLRNRLPVPRADVRGVSERVLPDGSVVVALDHEDSCGPLRRPWPPACSPLPFLSCGPPSTPPMNSERRSSCERHFRTSTCRAPTRWPAATASTSAPSRDGLNAALGPFNRGLVDRMDRRLRDEGFRGQLSFMTSAGAPRTVNHALSLPCCWPARPAAGVAASTTFASRQRPLRHLVRHGRDDVRRRSAVEGRAHAAIRGRRGRVACSTGRAPTWPRSEPEAGAWPGSTYPVPFRACAGPASAGAEPGPACYGRGGTQPTVTDANLVLGYPGARLLRTGWVTR